ncbi:lysophospholipase A [Diplogelasinospora grovesii]|uniref:Lysophospholipase A n=1 Tax=Diplogelasinospora grovesii TaxID=303347 RepID=A0AAN6MXN4_9PEZI|nr:lysophospholipase A [Diplogelasinospora grovesii]
MDSCSSLRQILALAACAAASVAVAATLPASQAPFSWERTKYLIAFGDSYTYVQGTAGRQNFSFIGDYLPGNFAYTPEQLLENKIVQNFTGTAEGGPNWVEFLTGCGVSPGLTSPMTCTRQLWDFAFAGADVSEEFTPLHHNYTVPLVNQTQQFLTYAQPVLKRKLRINPARTLVVVWIGINDISDTASYNSTVVPSFAAFYDSIISTVFRSSVAPLVEQGGHRNFLFINLPPLDRTPSNAAKTADNRSPNATMVGWWNDALARHARDFATTYKSAAVTAMVYDANAFLNGVLDHPSAYGITNTTAYCAGYTQLDVLTDPAKYGCPVPINQYFWFNGGHMTSHVHEVMASDIERFLVAHSAQGGR